MTTSAIDLVRDGMDALMRADAASLERLAVRAGAVQLPAGEAERRILAGERRTFLRLLDLTGRNIRLLGGVAGARSDYGEPRG